MKKIYHHIYESLIAILLISELGFIAPAIAMSANNIAIPDSLLTKEHIYKFTFSDQKKARQIIQRMRDRKIESEFVLDVAEGDLYFNNGKYNDALVFYKRVLESDSIENNDTEYMEQLHRMISCYDCLHNEAEKAKYVKLLLAKAEKCRNIEMKSVALFNMGKMIYYQEDKEQAYQLIKNAIALMKQADYKYKYDNLRYNYNTLLIMQQRDKRYEDALQTLAELEIVTDEATQEEPEIEGFTKKERKTMYAQKAVILSQIGKMKEANEAYRQWEAIGKAYIKDDYLIIPYLMNSRQFDKVIEMYLPREEFLRTHNDTINYHMVAIKRSLGKAYEGKKEYKKAIAYFEQLATLTDSLKVREQKSAAIELATAYETYEKEAKLQEQTSRVKVRNALLWSAGTVIVFLLILFGRNIQYTRAIHRKNKVLVHTIDELLTYKEKLFATRDKLQNLKEKNTDAENTIKQTHPILEIDTEEHEIKEQNKLLFEHLEHIMTEDKLYLSPKLSREDLMQKLQVDKNRLAQIIQENTQGNLSSYISSIRLKYAITMFKQYPNYTIQAIAEDSGIPNVRTFQRLFKEKIGMTPTEYRNAIKEKGETTTEANE